MKKQTVRKYVGLLLQSIKEGTESLEIDARHYKNEIKTQLRKKVKVHIDEGQNTGTLEAMEKKTLLNKIDAQVSACSKCPLSSTRTRAVPGEGVLNPLVLVIGEAPGAEEDRLGRPFVGKAGNYLDTWLDAIQLSRKKNIFITNVVKCRPPQNRDPEEEECRTCNMYLMEQIHILKPKLILCLGRVASRFLSNKNLSVANFRREQLRYNAIPFFVTYHPSAVLRNPDYRRLVWIDLQKLQKALYDLVGKY